MSAQEEFDRKYISSTEICQQMRIHRTTVLLAVKTDRLPAPIVIKRPNGDPHIMLWERATIQPHLTDWAANRAERASA